MTHRGGLCIAVVLFCSFLSHATSITGTVSDSGSGDKLANAIVSLRTTNGVTTVARDTTGADGIYSLADITTPGNFTLRATVNGYLTKNTAITIDTAEASMTTDIEVVKIDTTSVNGTVTDSAEGTPVSGAIVSIGSGPNAISDTTGSDGKYSFEKVASGSYSVRVTAQSFITKTVTVAVSGTSPITADVKLVKIEYATVSGTVTDSATPATLVAGAIVTLRSGNTTVKTDTTDADGAYQFDSVATGAYTVRATAALYVTKTVNAAVSGATPVTVDIALVKVIISSVSGTVSDSATPATLIEGAIVTLRSGNTTVKTDTTDADGAYQFDSIPVGNYTIRATASGYTVKNVSAAIPDTTPVTVDIALVKLQYGSLSGTVKDSLTGAPLTGAIVTVRSGNMAILADTTGDDGSYSFDSIPTGIYTIRAADSSYMNRTAIDTVQASTADTINFLLVHQASVAFYSKPDAALRDYFTFASKGVLSFGSGARAGDISVFGLDGRQLYRRRVSRNTVSLSLPENLFGQSNALIIRYRGPGFSYRIKTLIP